MDGLDRIPWKELKHAYGSAEDVPALLRALKTASPDLRCDESPLRKLFGNIWHQGTVYEATSYAVPFLVELAADMQTPDRVGVLELLASIAEGTSFLDVHEDLLRHYNAYRGGKRKFEQEKLRELTWVAKAHEAVLEGFDAFVEMTSEHSDVRYAAANVLSRLRSRVQSVGPLLRRLLEEESRNNYRAGLILLLGEVGDRSEENLAILTRAASDSDIPQRRASAVSFARLNLPELPAVAREAIVEAILDDELEEYFEALPWEASDSIDHSALRESVRSDWEEIATRLIEKIENCDLGSETVDEVLHLLFPMVKEGPPPDRTPGSLMPLQLRAVRALVYAMDQGERIDPFQFFLWGLPSTKRELRNLAAGRPRTVIDMSLPLLGNPDNPREALVPGQLIAGQQIYHRNFGLGVVTEVAVCGNETKLTVQFDEEGEKYLGLPSDGSPINQTFTGRPQFGLRAMLWTLLAIGMTLAYLRRLETPAVFLDGTIAVAIAVVVGGVMGWIAGRTGDATYWSVIITTAAFLSVAAERAYGPTFPIAWSAVGTTAGVCCGLIAPGRLFWRMLAGGLIAGATMLVFSAIWATRSVEVYFDLLCAPIVGALVGLLIEIILWLERKSYAPRYITASWLLCAVIIGNLMVPWVRG